MNTDMANDIQRVAMALEAYAFMDNKEPRLCVYKYDKKMVQFLIRGYAVAAHKAATETDAKERKSLDKKACSIAKRVYSYMPPVKRQEPYTWLVQEMFDMVQTGLDRVGGDDV